ncbi:MAG: cysteine synthase A [Bacteroidales bacterium]|nr:cysteine synthase A [Bacteroidales bacterium]
MEKTHSSVASLIGHTPLIRLERLAQKLQLKGRILAKVESFNPGGSVKDRIALAMIEAAEAAGKLQMGSTIVEPTSGNTGVGIAMVAAARGYRCIIVMPDTMTVERRRLVSAYGAELVLTPGSEGMKGAIARAEEIRQGIAGAITLGQFENPANPAAHLQHTAPEIWEQTGGKVDVLVAGVGTGGTVSGTGRGLKARNAQLEVVAVEPEESPVLSGGKPSPHKIQGIGAGFIPANYDATIVDRVLPISSVEAMETARLLARTEGIVAGISSGAALAAALQLASIDAYAGKNIVVILPDTGDRYLSTPLFGE